MSTTRTTLAPVAEIATEDKAAAVFLVPDIINDMHPVCVPAVKLRARMWDVSIANYEENTRKLSAMVDINKHPTLRQCYRLCMRIEEFPASTAQTALSEQARTLLTALDRFLNDNELYREEVNEIDDDGC